MATIKFILQSNAETASIYLRISVTKNEVFKRKTGFVINPKDWDSKIGTPVKKTKADEKHKYVEAQLPTLRGHVLSMFNSANSKGVVIDGNWLSNTIESFYNRKDTDDLDYLISYCNYFLEQLPYRATSGKGEGVGKRTQEKYTNIVNKLKAFEISQKRKFRLVDFNVKFRNDFMKFLLTEQSISKNTAGRYITVPKTIVLDARKNGYEISPQIDDVKGQSTEVPTVTLSFEELNKIRTTEFTNPKLESTRDWLVISCFTGQRVGDFMRMNPKLINTLNGLKMISLEQEKTKALVSIPIHKEVREILEKRNGNFPERFSSDSAANNAIYNGFLKTVCKAAGINEITKGNLTNPETGIYGEGNYPKWMLVTSHIGRRSFATNFYATEEFPTPWLMSITGHTTEKMFLSYIGKKQIDHSVLLGEKWKALGLI